MTPWKIAMERAAREARSMDYPRVAPTSDEASAYDDMAERIADWLPNVPEPPEFRAAREADEEMMREAAEHIRRLHMRAEDAVAVLCEVSSHPSDTADVAAGMLAGAADRAADLLAKLGERLK